MDQIIEDVARILGLDLDNGNENTLVETLKDLNDIRRKLDNRIQTLNNEMDNLQSEIQRHNMKAKEEVQNGNTNRAKKELKFKNKKLDKISDIQSNIADLREKRDRIENKREKIINKID